jgi:hypothetical protein
MQQGSDRPAGTAAAATRGNALRRLVIWGVVVLVVIAVLAPLGFWPFG